MNEPLGHLVTLQRLLIITVLSGLVGIERERHGRAAGFRTHILVGVGSCLVMLTGLYMVQQWPALDPSRMGAQVVSGIGFLGAGTILRFGTSIRGLTTAASLWAVGCIGLAVGAGFVWGAAMTAGIVVLALFALSSMERAVRREWYRTLIVDTESGEEVLNAIRSILSAHHAEVHNFQFRREDQSNELRVELTVKLASLEHEDEILQQLLRIDGTKRAHWA